MNDKVAIVGSGLVGRAWAISFARGGHDVVLFDTDDKAVANALRTVEGLLTKLELAGMLKGQTAVEVRSRINGAPSLEAALAGAAHVQENAPEELGVKREIFAKRDAGARTMLTSIGLSSPLRTIVSLIFVFTGPRIFSTA